MLKVIVYFSLNCSIAVIVERYSTEQIVEGFHLGKPVVKVRHLRITIRDVRFYYYIIRTFSLLK